MGDQLLDRLQARLIGNLSAHTAVSIMGAGLVTVEGCIDALRAAMSGKVDGVVDVLAVGSSYGDLAVGRLLHLFFADRSHPIERRGAVPRA